MSLLEILFSFTMFVTVMIPLMSVWVTHARAFNQSQDQEVAGAIAQQLMEQSLNLGFQAVSIPTPPPVYIVRTLRGVPETSMFNYTVAVTDPVPPALGATVTSPLPIGPTHKVVVVAVAWHDSTGNHTVSMESNAGW